MHIVYKIVFPDRKKLGVKPSEYIGSKSNCTVVNGVILNNKGKPYWGSSRSKDFLFALENEEKTVEVLYQSDIYENALQEERRIHIELDVVANPNYFNLSIANANTFTNPSFALYKHIETGKRVRLDRNHPLVKSGIYVGITKGVKYSDERKDSISKRNVGENNPFYNKRHTDKTKKAIGLKNSQRVKSKEEIENWVKKVAKRPMTDERREILSKVNSGKLVLKNAKTGECIKIDKTEIHLYDKTIWKNPAAITQKRETCKVCGKTTTVGNIVRWHNDKCKEIK
ncbi:MAG: NUMOD3 domain-containing DNA-binding protein [Prevotella sp.]